MLATSQKLVRFCVCLLWVGNAAVAMAQPSESAESVAEGPAIVDVTPESSHVEPGPQPIDKGDHAWMLVSSALVLMMTAPAWRCFIADWCAKRMCSAS